MSGSEADPDEVKASRDFAASLKPCRDFEIKNKPSTSFNKQKCLKAASVKQDM